MFYVEQALFRHGYIRILGHVGPARDWPSLITATLVVGGNFLGTMAVAWYLLQVSPLAAHELT